MRRDTILKNRAFQSQHSFFINSRRILYCYIFNILELLAVHTRFFHHLLMKWRKPVYLQEIHLANIRPVEQVLHIGCGIFPTETMLIATETKASVVGIDNSYTAVRLARNYIQKRGLEQTVTIQLGDGKDFPVDQFAVVFVAINVFPIDSVLIHLSKQMKKNGRIICKSFKCDIPQVLTRQNITSIFSIEQVLKNPKSHSYLLRKQV